MPGDQAKPKDDKTFDRIVLRHDERFAGKRFAKGKTRLMNVQACCVPPKTTRAA